MLYYDTMLCLLHSWFSTIFRAGSVYMILDNHGIIRLIFQKGPNVIEDFIIGFYYFEILQTLHDTCIYRVRLGNFNTIIFFVGIDADSLCDYRSNIDFVYFIWFNFVQFSTRKIAINILPSDNVPPPLNLYFALPSTTKLLYLKYYRAISDSLCQDKRNCNQCMVKNRYSYKLFVVADGLKVTAFVLLVKESLSSKENCVYTGVVLVVYGPVYRVEYHSRFLRVSSLIHNP